MAASNMQAAAPNSYLFTTTCMRCDTTLSIANANISDMSLTPHPDPREHYYVAHCRCSSSVNRSQPNVTIWWSVYNHHVAASDVHRDCLPPGEIQRLRDAAAFHHNGFMPD
jgi:hypothetical protein